MGAAAGSLCVGALANPLVAEADPSIRLAAAGVTTIVAAVLGAELTRLWGSRPALVASVQRRRATLLGALALAGALAGAIVGVIDRETPAGVMYGGPAGLVAGLASFPVVAAVLRAAVRAQRARHGSWVAASDRRQVWSILATALSLGSLLALPDWPAAANGARTDPRATLLIVVPSAVVCVLCLVADVRLLRALRRVLGGVSRFAPADDLRSSELEAAPSVDVGLGAGAVAEIGRGDAYRMRDRALAVIVGDAAAARSAVARSARWSGLGVLICGVVLALHGASSGATASRLYLEAGCAIGFRHACSDAAEQHVRGEGLGASRQRAVALLAEACRLGQNEACIDLARRVQRRELAMDASEVRSLLGAACQLGRKDNCNELIEFMILTEPVDGYLLRALGPLYRAACNSGDERACLAHDVVVHFPDDHRVAKRVALCLRGFAVECQAGADELGIPQGEAVPLDDAWRRTAAPALRAMACADGLAWSCHVAAWHTVQDAEELPANARQTARETAATLYARACHLGSGFSCCEAAYHQRSLGEWHEPEARALYNRGVEAGYGSAGACDVLHAVGW